MYVFHHLDQKDLGKKGHLFLQPAGMKEKILVGHMKGYPSVLGRDILC